MSDLLGVFKKVDRNGDGFISAEELTRLLTRVKNKREREREREYVCMCVCVCGNMSLRMKTAILSWLQNDGSRGSL